MCVTAEDAADLFTTLVEDPETEGGEKKRVLVEKGRLPEFVVELVV